MWIRYSSLKAYISMQTRYLSVKVVKIMLSTDRARISPPSLAFPEKLQCTQLSVCVCILAASPRESGLLKLDLQRLFCVWKHTRSSWKHDLWEASLARPCLTSEQLASVKQQLAQCTPINCNSSLMQLQKMDFHTHPAISGFVYSWSNCWLYLGMYLRL